MISRYYVTNTCYDIQIYVTKSCNDIIISYHRVTSTDFSMGRGGGGPASHVLKLLFVIFSHLQMQIV